MIRIQSAFIRTLRRGVLCAAAMFCAVTVTNAATPATTQHAPEVILPDPHLHVTFGEQRLVLPGGLQPSMLCTKTGALIVLAQVPGKPAPTTRIAFFSPMSTVISRDRGTTWTKLPEAANPKNLNMEGGAIQLRDGRILLLDTYITPTATPSTKSGTAPSAKPDQGLGWLFTSRDDLQTLDGPADIHFDLPNINFYASADDGGHPHAAQRLHRRMIELPNGDLLATIYGQLQGDATPSTYQPKMMKARAMLARSSDGGQHWRLISTIAVDPKVGTEGFCEPVLCRISKGDHAGRLLCLMRTGRELFEATSNDEGVTWTKPRPRVFADIDIYRTDLWIDQLRQFKDFHGKLLDENNPEELRGAAVDPDLIELRSGLLVAAFGVRIPQKLCWQHPEHPWNGNYLAISRDHGETWSHVIRVTSGILTTHYMAIEETPTDNQLYITYDLGGWSKGMPRDIYGRTVSIESK